MPETATRTREEAIQYYAERFGSEHVTVQADAPGYETPRELNGATPDLLAVGARAERAFVIETDRDGDEARREKLREWADGHVQRLFRWGVLTDDGTVDRWRE